jgi:hypothetical protein
MHVLAHRKLRLAQHLAIVFAGHQPRQLQGLALNRALQPLEDDLRFGLLLGGQG